MRPILGLLALCSISLAAQAPAVHDEAWFKGDPKAIMTACADRARGIKPMDSRLVAEYGHAYLASGDRTKAEEAFTAAPLFDLKDGETYRLIAYAWLRHGFKADARRLAEKYVLTCARNLAATGQLAERRAATLDFIAASIFLFAVTLIAVPRIARIGHRA